jgi:hypothetical protein
MRDWAIPMTNSFAALAKLFVSNLTLVHICLSFELVPSIRFRILSIILCLSLVRPDPVLGLHCRCLFSLAALALAAGIVVCLVLFTACRVLSTMSGLHTLAVVRYLYPVFACHLCTLFSINSSVVISG